jgi:hypothetical protein
MSVLPESSVHSLPIEYITKLGALRGNTAYKSIVPIDIGDLAEVQIDGALPITLPGESELIFDVKEVEAKDTEQNGAINFVRVLNTVFQQKNERGVY